MRPVSGLPALPRGATKEVSLLSGPPPVETKGPVANPRRRKPFKPRPAASAPPLKGQGGRRR
eukprot:10907263-Alexandrium_andersonii.AAC.1